MNLGRHIQSMHPHSLLSQEDVGVCEHSTEERALQGEGSAGRGLCKGRAVQGERAPQGRAQQGERALQGEGSSGVGALQGRGL